MRGVADTDVRTIRLRYKAAYEAYHALKSGTGVSPQEYHQAALDRLEAAQHELMAALASSSRAGD
jgi:hypothetical protein